MAADGEEQLNDGERSKLPNGKCTWGVEEPMRRIWRRQIV